MDTPSVWEAYSLKNAPMVEKFTIEILKGTPEWDAAYQNFLNMKPPTDSKEWKKGVYLSMVNKNPIPTTEQVVVA